MSKAVTFAWVQRQSNTSFMVICIPCLYQFSDRDLSIDFVMGLPISTDWKRESYDSIIVIVDWLIKMVYYELVKMSINALELAEVILDMVIQYHGLPDSIVTNQSSFFTSKFWSLLCYFFKIKQRLSIAFYS